MRARPFRSPLLRAVLTASLLAAAGCEDEKDREERFADFEARQGAGTTARDPGPSGGLQSGEGTVAKTLKPFSPIGTRAEALRCQAALGNATEYFSNDWYTYSDRDNPDTAIEGCDVGMTGSLLEALPWGEGRTNLCAIRWIVDFQRVAKYPYAGMGVRMRTKDAAKLAEIKEVVIETRSREPVTMEAQFLMVDQENLECGDERKSPYGATVQCDGTDTWTKQVITVGDVKPPAWGKPPPFSMSKAVALHFHMGKEAMDRATHQECDVRIIEVR
jgi:hypothetical protein